MVAFFGPGVGKEDVKPLGGASRKTAKDLRGVSLDDTDIRKAPLLNFPEKAAYARRVNFYAEIINLRIVFRDIRGGDT